MKRLITQGFKILGGGRNALLVCVLDCVINLNNNFRKQVSVFEACFCRENK